MYTSYYAHKETNDEYHNKYFQPRSLVSISPATKRICNQPSNGTYQGSTNQFQGVGRSPWVGGDQGEIWSWKIVR